MSSLTYDQKSEIRMAFDEAFIAPERRRDVRIKHRVNAEICLWKKGKQGLPFSVGIEDFSPTGVGAFHTSALSLGDEYLLRVPRKDADDLVLVLTVVRCKPQDNGTYLIGLELSSVMDRSAMNQFVDELHQDALRVTSRKTKLLLCLLGIFGIGMALILG